MLQRMSEVEGFHYEETLTGFKWLGSRADELKKEGKEIVFAFEESIGYMIGDLCWDKDGIRTAGIFAEMAGYLKFTENISVFDYLNQIYDRYGFFATLNGYVYCYDPNTMKTLFDAIRVKKKKKYLFLLFLFFIFYFFSNKFFFKKIFFAVKNK